MVLIVCVDDKMGMAFNNRRQSRDEVVCKDILALSGGETIGMDARSMQLFENLNGKIEIGPLTDDMAYYFLEFEKPQSMLEKANGLVLYRWNRHYPSDLKFDASLELFSKTETTEMAGKSHEKITREVYVREK